MGSVSRVVGNQAAPAEKNGDMGATVDFPRTLQLELAYQVATDGKATVKFTGELDIATADQAYAYLRDVVDSQDGPVTMNLAELTFCDAAGLGVLARVAGVRAAIRPLPEAHGGPPVAAADHAHHRDGRGLPGGPHPDARHDLLASSGAGHLTRLIPQPAP